MRFIADFLLFVLLYSNGWGSPSRFFIRVNGTNAGTMTATETVNTQDRFVQIRSESTIVLKRGGDRVTLTERSIEKSHLDGRPLSLSYDADQAGFKTHFEVSFSPKNTAVIEQNGKKQTLAFPGGTLLEYGTRLKIKQLIASGSDSKIHFPVFSPTTQRTMTRAIQSDGIKKTPHGNFHKVTVIDTLNGFSVEQHMLVDSTGRMVTSTSLLMGLQIEYVPQAWQDVVSSKQASPDILIQTLFKASHYFPSGYDVRSATYLLKKVPDPRMIPQGPFQSVRIDGSDVYVTIKQPQLTEIMKAGRRPEALKDGPIVQCNLPEIRKRALELRKDTASDATFIQKVMDFVFNSITKKDYGVGFADTATILKSHQGDCTEHTVLAMALLRAGGVPARAAAGLVSINSVMGYHMWVEVFLNNQWIPVDPTFDELQADVSHIRLATTLLNDEGFQRDLVPVLQLVTHISVDPESVTLADGRVINDFTVNPTKEKLAFNLADYTVDLGEPCVWTPASTGLASGPLALGHFILGSDGLTVNVSVADIKVRRFLDRQIATQAADFSPLSFETIYDYPVVLGWNGKQMLVAFDLHSTLFQFTFSYPSDTMGETLKERAYNICLKLLSHVKRTDPDRR